MNKPVPALTPSDYEAVGKSKVKPDTLPKVTGDAKYTEDMTVPGMLHGRILRSPHAHAAIKSIDTSKAKALPGVAAVITFEDVPKQKFTRSSMAEALPSFAYEEEEVHDQYILSEKARYVGDWIAAVAAKDVQTAERALDLIEVDYDVLPAVIDPYKALGSNAPIVHDTAPDNIAKALDHPFNTGDATAALSASEFTVEVSARTSRQKHCHLEPDVAIATWGGDDRLTMISTSQGPHLCKKAFAQRIFEDLSEGDIRWISPLLGGGFGARLALNVEPLTAMLARVAGHPVKVTTTREEDFAGWGARTEQYQTLKIGANKDGELMAMDMKIMSDSGAYYSHSGTTALVNMQHTLGLLRCPNIHGAMEIVYTNTPTASGFRGYGNAEGAFILQQGLDMVAEKIGMDPIEFREKNIKQPGEPSFFTPVALEHCALEECIDQAAERAGWTEKWSGWGGWKKKTGRYRRGIGMSIMNHASGAGGFLLEHSNAQMKLNEDGTLNLIVAPSDMGQGILGVLSQIAAESVGLTFEDIHVNLVGDTDVTLFDIGSHACRSTLVIGNAVVNAGEKMRDKLLEIAVDKFGERQRHVTPSDLTIRAGVISVTDHPEETISVAEIAHDEIYNYGSKGAHLSTVGSYLSTSHNPNFQAAIAEIIVDTDTGVIKVETYTAAHDIGHALNPQNVEGQIEGGVAQGIGFALTEDWVVDQETGETLSDSFATYKIPTSLDMPEVVSILVEEPGAKGPYGAKGVGEPGLVNVAPAIANALYDAVGIRILSLPMSPEKVLEALDEQGA